jgi:acetoin utilization protein AcuB
MRTAEIMTYKVETIAPTATTDEARLQMNAQNIRHLVVTEGKRIVGVVSEADLGQIARSVEEIMTPDPITTTPDSHLREVANLLRGHRISCLPVVENDRLVGMVTTTDILDVIGRGIERPVERGERWTLKHRGPRHEKTRRPL